MRFGARVSPVRRLLPSPSLIIDFNCPDIAEEVCRPDVARLISSQRIDVVSHFKEMHGDIAETAVTEAEEQRPDIVVNQARSQVGDLVDADSGNLVRKRQIQMMPKLDISMVIFVLRPRSCGATPVCLVYRIYRDVIAIDVLLRSGGIRVNIRQVPEP